MWGGRLKNVPSRGRPSLGPGAWHCHRLWPRGVSLTEGGTCVMIRFCKAKGGAWDFLWVHMHPGVSAQPWWLFGGPCRWPWHCRPRAPPRSPVPTHALQRPPSLSRPRPHLWSAQGSWLLVIPVTATVTVTVTAASSLCTQGEAGPRVSVCGSNGPATSSRSGPALGSRSSSRRRAGTPSSRTP